MQVEQYECPECGALADEGTESCPECGLEFEYEDEEVEETLEVEPEETPDEDDTAPPVEEGTTPAVAPSSRGRPLSFVGMAFAVLAVVCVVGLLVVLNYDTWVAGESESHVGDTQVMYVYLAAAAVVACVVITVFDLVRNRGTTPS